MANTGIRSPSSGRTKHKGQSKRRDVPPFVLCYCICSVPTTAAPPPVHAIRRNWRRSRCHSALWYNAR